MITSMYLFGAKASYFMYLPYYQAIRVKRELGKKLEAELMKKSYSFKVETHLFFVRKAVKHNEMLIEVMEAEGRKDTTHRDIYKRLFSNEFGYRIEAGYTEDKATRLANIYAVKNTLEEYREYKKESA